MKIPVAAYPDLSFHVILNCREMRRREINAYQQGCIQIANLFNITPQEVQAVSEGRQPSIRPDLLAHILNVLGVDPEIFAYMLGLRNQKKKVPNILDPNFITTFRKRKDDNNDDDEPPPGPTTTGGAGTTAFTVARVAPETTTQET